MRLHLYSIYDRLMGVYLAPFVARGDVEALRQIRNTLTDSRTSATPLVTNPGDYDLYYMSSFDDETGEVFPVERAGATSGKPAFMTNIRALVAESTTTPPPGAREVDGKMFYPAED